VHELGSMPALTIGVKEPWAALACAGFIAWPALALTSSVITGGRLPSCPQSVNPLATAARVTLRCLVQQLKTHTP
jgi:hypothetical protein